MSAPGDVVQTPFGKGVIREVRNHGRLLVDVHDRALELNESDVSPIGGSSLTPKKAAGRSQRKRAALNHSAESVSREATPTASPSEIDLHGMTVAEALARAEQALNDALLGDAAEIRFIHGRSGGRIRAALHRRLQAIPSVRGFRLDLQNEGVTIVRL